MTVDLAREVASRLAVHLEVVCFVADSLARSGQTATVAPPHPGG